MSSLKENIQRYAKEKNMPVYKLEDEINVARGSISKWDSVRPSIDKVKAVADTLGKTIEQLLE